VVVDWFGTLEREIDLVWRPKWNFGSFLFFLLRYSTLSEFGIIMQMILGPNIPFKECNRIHVASSIVCATGIFTNHVILMLRTYALSGNKRLVFTVLALAFVANFIVTVVITTETERSLVFGKLEGIPLIGCFPIAGGKSVGTAFSMVLAVETLIFSITMWAGIVQKGLFQSPSHLAYILYRDSLIFYVYVFVIAVANVIVIFRAPPPLLGLLMVLQHSVHCISGTRIVLNVRGTASDSPGVTSELRVLEDELEAFQANHKSARSRPDKSQHSMLDIALDVKETTTLGSGTISDKT